jgi:hypothetical protein
MAPKSSSWRSRLPRRPRSGRKQRATHAFHRLSRYPKCADPFGDGIETTSCSGRAQRKRCDRSLVPPIPRYAQPVDKAGEFAFVICSPDGAVESLRIATRWLDCRKTFGKRLVTGALMVEDFPAVRRIA